MLVVSVWFVFTARQVVIQVEPKPDEIKIEGGIATPQIGTYYLMRPGEYMLRAVRQCFSPLNERLVVGDEKSQELKFSMTKLPGRLSFHVHRSDKPDVILAEARVIIGGREVQGPSAVEMEAMPGRHLLEIRAENYQSLQSEIEVAGCGALQKFNFALIPGWSDITIDSIPGGAAVVVDGKPAGSTPLTLELLAGEHDIELKADRYKPFHTRLVVEANRPQVLEPARLQPADGTLRVQTNPSGANVMLSDTFAGRTPLNLTLSSDTTHLIQLSKAGYETENRKVRVESAAEETLTVKLKPRLGTIQLVVAPADAEVVVDGKAMGRVPRKLSLVAVEHVLEIRKNGYQPYRTRFTPRPGFTQEIRVTLVREVTEGQIKTAIIRAKNGYELKLIRPRPFAMGSSRREQGRRSNETLRSVRLQRPFYMGLREVTNKEFREFFAGHDSGAFKGHSLNLDDLAVVEVTWEKAARFCNWLSIKESLPPVYIEKAGKLVAANPVGIGYRLPTEAEWEYCARFFKNESFLKYPWGDKFPPAGKDGNFADISAKDRNGHGIAGLTRCPSSFADG